jgi:hypothetical protein
LFTKIIFETINRIDDKLLDNLDTIEYLKWIGHTLGIWYRGNVSYGGFGITGILATYTSLNRLIVPTTAPAAGDALDEKSIANVLTNIDINPDGSNSSLVVVSRGSPWVRALHNALVTSLSWAGPTNSPTYAAANNAIIQAAYDALDLDTVEKLDVNRRIKKELVGTLSYMKRQSSLAEHDNGAMSNGRYADDMRVPNSNQVVTVNEADEIADKLLELGRLRFDTVIVRNLVFIVNMYRSLRLKLNKELTYNKEIVSRAQSIVRPEITEYMNNQVWAEENPYQYARTLL